MNGVEISDEQSSANHRFMELVVDSVEPPRDLLRYGRSLTAMQDIVDSLNRAVKDQVTCPHDILRPSSTEGGRILGILECARCGLIQESQALALLGVTIMRKMAACWTCGRSHWVWRLRERNFCSGKCRVRHHRTAYRKPSSPRRTRAEPG